MVKSTIFAPQPVLEFPGQSMMQAEYGRLYIVQVILTGTLQNNSNICEQEIVL